MYICNRVIFELHETHRHRGTRMLQTRNYLFATASATQTKYILPDIFQSSLSRKSTFLSACAGVEFFGICAYMKYKWPRNYVWQTTRSQMELPPIHSYRMKELFEAWSMSFILHTSGNEVSEMEFAYLLG